MDTPDFFVGARLGGARIKAGISLEKAAKDTRIRVQRLREGFTRLPPLAA